MPRCIRLLATATLTALLAGCAAVGPLTPALAPIPADASGSVFGGQQPVAGTSIQLYVVGTSGDGSPATPLGTPVLTTAQGFFTFAPYTCPSPSALVYVLATGGNPTLTPGASNPQLAEMAALGPCSTLAASFIDVNEVTTVAAVYALAPFISAPAAIGSGSSDTSALASAFTLAAQLANNATGKSPGTGLPPGMSAPIAQIDTLANILASCVNTTGGAYNDGTPCGTLFYLTRAPGGATPTDTVSALLSLANNPTLNTSALYLLPVPAAPFQPSDPVQPTDFSVALVPFNTLTLTPSAGLTFPDTGLLITPAPLTATITNGPVSNTLGAITLTGTNAAVFSQTNNCPAVLPANASCNISVTFTPTDYGNPKATLNVTSSAANSPQSVAITGVAVSPTLTFSTTTLIFPTIAVGLQTPVQVLTLNNTGIGTATLAVPTVSSVVGARFGQTNDCPRLLPAGSFCTFMLTAIPDTTGGYSAILQIQGNNSFYPVTLTGIGLPAPAANLIFSNSVMYVPQTAYPADPTFLDITNSGSSPITISSVSTSSGFSQVSDCIGTLAPSAVCVVTLTAAAQSATVATGTLTVLSNDVASPQTVSLFTGSPGSGYNSPFVINVGSQVLGTTGGSKTLTYSSQGTSVDARESFSGLNAVDFGFVGSTGNCSGTPSCSVTTNFDPTGIGFRYALLNIVQNFYTSYSYLLVGFGMPVGSTNALTASPSSLALANTPVNTSSAPQTVTVSNPAGHLLNLGIQSPAANTPPQYTVSPRLCASTSCTVSVSFAPTIALAAGGAAAANLDIVDSVTNTTATVALSVPNLAVSLSGASGLLLQALGFPATSQTVTVNNIGNLPVTGISGAFTGPSASLFSVTSTTCSRIIDNSYSCYFTVTANAASAGTYNATFAVASNAPTVTTPVSLVATPPNPQYTLSTSALPSFGSVPVGSTAAPQYVNITNTGNVPVTITSFPFTGPNSGSFTGPPTFSIPVGETKTFAIGFTPLALGSNTATLTISSNAAPATIAVSGTGNSTPYYALSAYSLTFNGGYIPPDQVITLTNTGAVPITNLAVSTSEYPFNHFSAGTDCPASIPVGSTCHISVGFASGHSGGYSGTLTITSNAPTVSIPVSAVASPPSAQYTLSTTSLTLPSTYPGATSGGQSVSITNTGNVPVTISSFTFTGANPSSFAVSAPFTVPVGSSNSFTVAFAPAVVGPNTATLNIASNAAPATVNVSGTGISGPYFTLSPTGVNFNGYVGFPSTFPPQVVTLTNTGTVPITGLSGNITLTHVIFNPFIYTTNCPASIPVGATCSITITVYAGTQYGGYYGTLALSSNAPTQPLGLSAFINTPSPSLAIVSGGNATFPPQKVNVTSPPLAIVLTNTGNVPASASVDFASGGQPTSLFSVASSTCVQVPVGANCTLQITFTPTKVGPSGAFVTITPSGYSYPQIYTNFTASGISGP